MSIPGFEQALRDERHHRVAELMPRLKGRAIGRLRPQVRGHLAPELGEIDQLVRSILAA